MVTEARKPARPLTNRKTKKMTCKKDERRQVKAQQTTSSTSKPLNKSRPPLSSVENRPLAPPTVIISPSSDPMKYQGPRTPQARFNRRLSCSTPEPGKQSLSGQDWTPGNGEYFPYQRSSPEYLGGNLLVTLPSSPVNYSVNHPTTLTSTHPSSVHPTTSITAPIPTTQPGGNALPQPPPAYPIYVQYSDHPVQNGHQSVHYSHPPVQYPYNQPHSPPSQVQINHDQFVNLASKHFTPERTVHRPYSHNMGKTSPPGERYPSPPRPDSPRPTERPDGDQERLVDERSVHFDPDVRDVDGLAAMDYDSLQDSQVTFSPDNVRNKMATLHYLLGELRVLAEGDSEVSRIVGEVQSTVEEVSPLRSATSFQAEVEQALQPLRTENSQLRRRLRILNHQLKEREKKEKENVRPETNFDLAHLQAKYESLQVKYNEERERTSRLQDDLYRTECLLEEVKTDRQKIVMTLSEKETEQMKIKHDWLHESTRLKKDLDSHVQRVEELRSRCELLEREKHILQLTIQQRDTDLTRVQDMLHDYKNRYHAQSSPMSNLSPPAPTASRLTRQALEEFNNNTQKSSHGHKSPIERLGLENPVKTPGCSPKLTKEKHSDRSVEKKEKRVKSPQGASFASTPYKKQNTITTELDNSNLSSLSMGTRSTSPTLVSTNIPSASQVNADQMMAVIHQQDSEQDNTIISSVTTDSGSTITMAATATTARYQPSAVTNTATEPNTLVSSKLSKDSSRYTVSEYYDKYGSAAVDRYQSSATSTFLGGASTMGGASTTDIDSKSDVTLMTNTSLSSINSQDDRSFRAGLADLDANIAKLQMALRTSSVI